MNPTEEQIERIQRAYEFTVKAIAEVNPTRGPLPMTSGMDDAVMGLHRAKTVFENFLRERGRPGR